MFTDRFFGRADRDLLVTCVVCGSLTGCWCEDR
jgi:hypothetical protein